MNKNLNPKKIVFIIVIFMISCTKKNSNEPVYMAFEEVSYIDKFPKEFHLKNKEVTGIETIGLTNFAIFDTLLILNTSKKSGLWSFYSIPNHQFLGSFIKRGDGPTELAQGPSLGSKRNLIQENSTLNAYLYDFEKGGYLTFNITKSLISNEENITRSNIKTPPFLSEFILLDSTTFYIKEIENMDTQQGRYILKNNKKINHPILDKLNQPQIKQGEDFNILASITKINYSNNRLVEMPTGLNYLNIFSLENNFSKTICIGSSLIDINKIQEEERQDRKYIFSDIRAFENFFGVVYINEGAKNYQTNRTNKPIILFFDWDGEPLAKVFLEEHLTSFDIDRKGKKIYTFDNQNDKFYIYDFSAVLQEINY